MSEQIVETKPAEIVVEVKPVVAEDIISRATKVELPAQEVKQTENIDNDVFDMAEYQRTLESIKDPVQKSLLEKSYKTFQRGYDRKFNTLAEEKKRTVALEQEYNNKIKEMSTWSPERLQVEMNKADFIQAAKVVMDKQQPAAKDENSLLSAEEQAKLKSMDDEIKRLKTLNEQALLQQQQFNTLKQDEEYKAKYANYDPRAIDTISADMLAGKAQVTREHVYKAFYHDENVRRAYELGKQDERSAMKERVGSASILPNGSAVSPSGIIKEDGESSINLFRRIGQKHLSEVRLK